MGTKGREMGNERDLSHIQRRINYLRSELYNYDKYFRDPQKDGDIATHAKWAIDADDCQKELNELEYLLDLHERMNRPAPIRSWQIIIMAVSTGLAVIVAGYSLYLAAMAMAVHP